MLNLFLHKTFYIGKRFIIFYVKNTFVALQAGAEIQNQAAGFCHTAECNGKYSEK